MSKRKRLTAAEKGSKPALIRLLPTCQGSDEKRSRAFAKSSDTCREIHQEINIGKMQGQNMFRMSMG
jgi:hypothetical protein